MTAILYLSAFEQTHKSVARAPLSVTCGAERRNISAFNQPSHHLVQSSPVRNVELLGVLGSFLLGVAAYACAAASAYLGNAEFNYSCAQLGAFSRGYYHSRIRNADSYQSAQLGENVVAYPVVERRRVYVVGAFYAGHTDCMRSHAVHGFQMLGVH